MYTPRTLNADTTTTATVLLLLQLQLKIRNIFYKNRLIVHFVPNFVAMATGIGRGTRLK